MMGFVLKDFLVMKKQLIYYLLFFVIYGGMGVMGTMSLMTVVWVVTVVGLLAPMTAFAYDEQSKWDKFAAATPAGRAGIVGGKYLFVLAVLGIGSVLVLLETLGFVLIGLAEGDPFELTLTVLVCAGTGMVLNAIYLPVIFKFGVEKSRILAILVSVASIGGIGAIAVIGKGAMTLPALPAAVMTAAIPVMVIGGFALSWKISLGIVNKKEY